MADRLLQKPCDPSEVPVELEFDIDKAIDAELSVIKLNSLQILAIEDMSPRPLN